MRTAMNRFVYFLLLLCTLAGCGYKGDLYLPKEHDPAQFGAVQTGLSIEPINPKNLPQND